MFGPATRLAAGTLVLALPLAAAAGCGAAKKRTIKQELASARDHLYNSKAASNTVHFTDPKGLLAKSFAHDGDADVAKEVVGGAISWTIDPTSDKTLRQLSFSPDTSEAALKKSAAEVNFALSVKDAQKTIGEIRLVEGTLWVRVDLSEIDRVAGGGVLDGFDGFAADAPAQFRAALADVRAGTWMTLPLTEYLGKVSDLVKDLPNPVASAAPDLDVTKVGTKLFDAVKPAIKVTDANDSSSDRVLDVKVDARAAAKAALGVLKAEKDLPFAEALTDVTASDVDDTIAAGTVNGQIRLSDGHLKQVSVDLQSFKKLDASDHSAPVTGSTVTIDVDDSADAVTAPTDNVSSVDVKALLDDLFRQFSESFKTTTTFSGTGVISGTTQG